MNAAALHEITQKVGRKILRAWGAMDSVVFRAEEIESLAADLGYRSSMSQLNGSEWLAAILSDLGAMPSQRSSIMDPNSAALKFRDGLPVPQRPGASYVASALNELLANGGSKLEGLLK